MSEYKVPNETLFAEMKTLKEKNVPDEKNYARIQLINNNYNLVEFVVNKYFKLNDDLKELVSIGTIGLINAVDNFDIARGMEFSTYASNVIKNIIYVYFQHNNYAKRIGQKYTISLNTPINSKGDAKELTLEGIIADDDSDKFPDAIAHKDEIRYLYTQLTHLTIDEQISLTLYYGLYGNQRNTLKKLSEIMNVDVGKIRSNLKKATSKLNTIFTSGASKSEILAQQYPRIKSYSDYIFYKDELKKNPSLATAPKNSKIKETSDYSDDYYKLKKLLPYTEIFKNKCIVPLSKIKDNLIHLTPMEQFALCSTYQIYNQDEAKFNSKIVAKKIIESNLKSAKRKLFGLLTYKKVNKYSYFSFIEELKRTEHQLIQSQEDIIKYLQTNKEYGRRR